MKAQVNEFLAGDAHGSEEGDDETYAEDIWRREMTTRVASLAIQTQHLEDSFERVANRMKVRFKDFAAQLMSFESLVVRDEWMLQAQEGSRAHLHSQFLAVKERMDVNEMSAQAQIALASPDADGQRTYVESWQNSVQEEVKLMEARVETSIIKPMSSVEAVAQMEMRAQLRHQASILDGVDAAD